MPSSKKVHLAVMSVRTPPATLEGRIREAILEMGSVRYVYISKKDGFFVFKIAGSYLSWGEESEAVVEYMPSVIHGNKLTTTPRRWTHCWILHNDKLLERGIVKGVITKNALLRAGFDADAVFQAITEAGDDDAARVVSSQEAHINIEEVDCILSDLARAFPRTAKKLLKFLQNAPMSEVENYLRDYGDKIAKAPEFLLDGLFTAKLRLTNDKEKGYTSKDEDTSKNTFTEVDYLIPRKDIKILSTRHWRPINDLLRRVSLLKEKRGTGRTPSEATVAITNYVAEKLKENKNIKAAKIKKDYDKFLHQKYPHPEEGIPEEEAKRKAEESARQIKIYQRNEETIRKIMKAPAKK